MLSIIAGYDQPCSDLHIIVEVREMTLRKEFDVLPVFMFDRLGRKEDETPFPVKWFIGHGTEVWSAGKAGSDNAERTGPD